MFKTLIVSSLVKVFPEPSLPARPLVFARALRGEVFSFQIAFKADNYGYLSAKASGTLAPCVRIRSVKAMPSDYPADDCSSGPEEDNGLLKGGMPGLYPDLLTDLYQGHIAKLQKYVWASLWVTVDIPGDFTPGEYDLEVELKSLAFGTFQPDGVISRTVKLPIRILSHRLPDQEIKRLEWFHADCIWYKYGVPCWSEEHWELLRKYISNAAAHGINVMYTPLWTPPLDTAVGSERPTVQLLDIQFKKGKYAVGTERLERYVKLALDCGMKYFEMSHAFTQWGAKATPKIIVKVNGKEEKKFGWNVPADSPEYAEFLKQVLPSVLNVLRKYHLQGKCWFPVSDEPSPEGIESYSAAARLLRSNIGEFETLDALSHYEFYEKGLVGNPIPAVGAIESFVGKVDPLWIYYCCAGFRVTNRFFAMPSPRTRVLGVLLYLYNVSGFLQWGYNFWYSQYSMNKDIDVYLVTDADRSFPSGDAFLVYPGKDGPEDSIRNEVLREAFQDHRLLRLLEKKIGRQAVLDMINDGVGYKISMKLFPQSEEWILGLRNRLMKKLDE